MRLNEGANILEQKKSRNYAFNFAAFICFLIALVLIILIRIFRQPEFLHWYGRYTDTLSEYELWLQTYGATVISVVVILFNFFLKSVLPWFPVSCICVASSILFNWYEAVIINVIGMSILYSVGFYKGKRNGAGNAEKLLGKYKKIHDFIDNNESGSSAVLFVLRIIPLVPINQVSTLYGTTNISYPVYLVVSVLGSAYKIISYTIIGRNVFDPASASFIVPLILLFMFSGIVLLILSGAITIKTKLTVKKPFFNERKNKNG